MMLVVANYGMMCSTLILGNINWRFDKTDHENIEGLTKQLQQHSEACFSGHRFRDYGFVVCTLEVYPPGSDDDPEDYQDRVMEWLKTLGFSCSNPSYNHKNGTYCVLMTIAVPELIERLKEIKLISNKKKAA